MKTDLLKLLANLLLSAGFVITAATSTGWMRVVAVVVASATAVICILAVTVMVGDWLGVK